MTTEEFEHIAHALRPHLLKVGQHFYADNNDAEDVVQETLLRLWLIHSRINVADNIKSLALRIAHNYCVSCWRQRQVQSEQLSNHIQIETTVTPHTQMEDNDNSRWLQQAMKHLTPSSRRLLYMKQDAAMDIAQIAAVTNITPHTVSDMISKARRQLYNELLKRQRHEERKH